MKEEYCRAVAGRLDLLRRDKHRVLEDLADTFEAAREQGETDQATEERLGPPEEFAREINLQLGPRKNRSRLLVGGLCCLVCLGCGVGAALLWSLMRNPFPSGAIGGAVTVTSIQVMGSSWLSPELLLGLCVLGCLGAGALAVRLLRRFAASRRKDG